MREVGTGRAVRLECRRAEARPRACGELLSPLLHLWLVRVQAERVEHAQARRAQLKGLEDLDVEHDERPIWPDAPRPEERAHEAVGAHIHTS